MKKIIIILTILTLIGCNSLNKPLVDNKHYRTYLKFVVFYPNYRDTVSTYVDDNDYNLWSQSGTNYITIDGKTVYSNSAPYKVLEHYKKEMKKEDFE